MTTKTAITIPSTTDLNKDIAHFRERANDIVVIRTPAAYEAACDALKQIKEAQKNLDAQRKTYTAPLDAEKKRIMETYREPMLWLDAHETALKRAIADYMREEERRRQEAEKILREQQEREAEKLRKAAAEAAAKAAAAAQAGDTAKAAKLEAKADGLMDRADAVPTSVVLPSQRPKVAGVASVPIWRARVTDLDKLPREYMLPNQSMLDQVAKATKGALQIPGVEFYSEDSIRAGSR